MTWNELKGNWRVLEPRLRRHWYRLSNDDVASVNGEREVLIRRLQDRYGFCREHAEREIDAWTWLVQLPRAAWCREAAVAVAGVRWSWFRAVNALRIGRHFVRVRPGSSISAGSSMIGDSTQGGGDACT